MKKAILAVLALASVVACNKSEVLEVAPQKAISFGNPFVDNSTKAPIDPSLTHGTDGTLTEFNVYGVLKNSNNAQTKIFDNVEVTKTKKETTDISGTNTWFYDGDAVQYWIPGNKYTFAALAKGTAATYGADLLPATVSYTADGTTDLLYATSKVDITTGDVDFSSNIAFTFNHLLSKVKFTFKNEYPADSKLVVTVSNIQITNAIASGVCTLSTKSWDNTDENATTPISFGNIVSTATEQGADAAVVTAAGLESNFERLLIPGQSSFAVTFDAKVTLNNVLVNSYTGATVTVDGGLQPGYSYNFVGTIGKTLDKITFSVEKVNGYEPADNENITLQ